MANIVMSYDLLNPDHVDLAKKLHQRLRVQGVNVELLDVDRLGIKLSDFTAKRNTPNGATALTNLYAKAALGSNGAISFEMADAMARTMDGGEVRIRDPRAGVLGQVTKTVSVYLGQSRVIAHQAKAPGGFNAKDVQDKNFGNYESDDELADLVKKGLRWCGLA